MFQKLVLLAIAIFSISSPQALAASPGDTCTEALFGSTKMATDGKNIIACLKPDTGTDYIWKSMTSTSSSLPNEAIFTSSGAWTIPVGVTKIRIKAAGAGGAGGPGYSYNGNDGGPTHVWGTGFDIYAYGGNGGCPAQGFYAQRADPASGSGGTVITGGGATGGLAWGMAIGGEDEGGGSNGMPGGLTVKTVDVASGDVVNISIGTGGVGAKGGSETRYGSPGSNGYVIIQYQ